MRIGVLLIAGATLLSGCTGLGQTKQDTQLRTDLDALNLRVIQLEEARAQQLAGTSAASTEDTTVPPGPIGETDITASLFIAPSTIDVQHALKDAGLYEGPIDGKRGPMTRAAIRAFQRTHGLQVDGIIGAQTWSRLASPQDLDTTAGEDPGATDALQ